MKKMKIKEIIILIFLFSLIMFGIGAYIGSNVSMNQCNTFIEEKIKDGTFILPYKPENKINFTSHIKLNQSFS